MTNQHAQPQVPNLCLYCKDQWHPIGHPRCEKHQEQTEIIKLQNTEKVGFLRARQMYNDKESLAPTFQPLKVLTDKKFFKLIINKEQKKNIRPWLLEKAIEERTKEKPTSNQEKSTWNL